ncbi:MAG: hypothetical protein CSA03_00970 [Bacteroidetes bacterium]|nr:MAG: hypothetical protein CSA03_00970 [Bacteroidota bacterium]
MDKIADQFFSMRMMALAMIVFFVAIGGATFLESSYDTQTAKLYIYNATWFNLLLAYLALNLMANIMRHKMIQLKKWALLLFHVSFIVILIGAAITRFVSFEGMMIIAEGDSEDFIYSSNPHVSYRITDKKLQLTNDHPLYLSELDWWNNFSHEENFPNHSGTISIDYVDYHKNMIDSVITNDSIQGSAIELVHLGESKILPENGFLNLDNVAFSFEKANAMPGVEFFKDGNKVNMKVAIPGGTSLPMSVLQVADRTTGVPDSMYQAIPYDTIIPLEMATLYRVGDAQFVFKSLKKHTKKARVQSQVKDAGMDDLIVRVTDGDKSKVVTLTGGISAIPAPTMFELNGLTYEMSYGPKIIKLPFSIGCSDFRLERYPGSNVASSYESDLEIIDEQRGYNRKQTVFMNNVMDYRGYRFFQSSYFPDEKGTKLSVNHDRLGTIVTYIGYLLMTLGMVFSLFAKGGRMRELVRKLIKSHDRKAEIQNSAMVLALVLSMSAFGHAQVTEDHSGHDHSQHDHSDHDHDHSGHNHDHGDHDQIDPVADSTADHTNHADHASHSAVPNKQIHHVMSEELSDEMAGLLLFNCRQRIIPFHTFATELLRKVHRSDKYNDYNAVQTVMSMHMYPGYWVEQDLIYIDSKGGIRDRFDGKSHVSWYDLTGPDGNFIFFDEYQEAHQKKESQRNEFEKRLMKIAERYTIVTDVAFWRLMKIIPSQNDPNGGWYVPYSPELTGADTLGNERAANFFKALANVDKTGSEKQAHELLKELKSYQREVAGEDACPSVEDVEMEIRYNKMNIVKNSAYVYGLVGFILLIVFFIGIFVNPSEKSRKRMKVISLILIGVLGLTFLYHGYGVYMRAMITGYAPWSNGYEAMVFIALVIMFVGFLPYKKYPVVTAAAAILAFLVLFVSQMNLLDPEITPMQPVLKSYWLMIHVAIITGSYAPLGISCLLGLLVLTLYIFRNQSNAKIINININELTYISEIFMTVGLFMLTIGTFLGGIWANESWGRYWGWDPKETWALVAVLVYAVILHLRYIPGLKGKFLFNAVGFWGYTSILFTFFGVNFYLVGLHSYAQGDGLGEVPMWIKLTVLFFALFTAFAAYRNWQFKQKRKEKNVE